MLAGKAVDAAAVDNSFKNSRRSVLMRIHTSPDRRVPAIACGRLAPLYCASVTIECLFGDLLLANFSQHSRLALLAPVLCFPSLAHGASRRFPNTHPRPPRMGRSRLPLIAIPLRSHITSRATRTWQFFSGNKVTMQLHKLYALGLTSRITTASDKHTFGAGERLLIVALQSGCEGAQHRSPDQKEK
jgi:hypothetical protein